RQDISVLDRYDVEHVRRAVILALIAGDQERAARHRAPGLEVGQLVEPDAAVHLRLVAVAGARLGLISKDDVLAVPGPRCGMPNLESRCRLLDVSERPWIKRVGDVPQLRFAETGNGSEGERPEAADVMAPDRRTEAVQGERLGIDRWRCNDGSVFRVNERHAHNREFGMEGIVLSAIPGGGTWKQVVGEDVDEHPSVDEVGDERIR